MIAKLFHKGLSLLRCPHLVGMGIIVTSSAALIAALVSEYGFGLLPCVLCKYQRYVYIATIPLGSLVLLSDFKRVFIGLSGLTYWLGAGIAAFHVGVEQRWWTGTEECGGSLPEDGSLEELLAAIQNAPVVRCTDIPWDMFGISMAGYNVLMSLGLGAACLLSVWMLGQKGTEHGT